MIPDSMMRTLENRLLNGDQLNEEEKESLGRVLLERKATIPAKRIFSQLECINEAENYKNQLFKNRKNRNAFIKLVNHSSKKNIPEIFKSHFSQKNSAFIINSYHTSALFKKAFEVEIEIATDLEKKFPPSKANAMMEKYLDNLCDLAKALTGINQNAQLKELEYLGIHGERFSEELNTCLQHCILNMNDKTLGALNAKVKDIQEFQKKSSTIQFVNWLNQATQLFNLDLSSHDLLEKEKIHRLIIAYEHINLDQWKLMSRTVPAFQEAILAIKRVYQTPQLDKLEKIHERVAHIFDALKDAAGIKDTDSKEAFSKKIKELEISSNGLKTMDAFLLKGHKQDLLTFKREIRKFQHPSDEEISKDTRARYKKNRELSFVQTRHIEQQGKLRLSEISAKHTIEAGTPPRSPKTGGVNLVGLIKAKNEELPDVYVKKGTTGWLETLMWDVAQLLGIDEVMVPTKMTHLSPEVFDDSLTIKAYEKPSGSIQLGQEGYLIKEIALLNQKRGDLEEKISSLDKAISELRKLFLTPRTDQLIQKKLKEKEELEEELAKFPKMPTIQQVGKAVIASLVMGSYDLHEYNALVDKQGNIKIFDNARSLPHGDLINYSNISTMPAYRAGLLLLPATGNCLSESEKLELLSQVKGIKQKVGQLIEYFKGYLGKSKMEQMPKTTKDYTWLREKEAMYALQLRLNRMITALEDKKPITLRDLAFEAIPDLKLYSLLHLLIDEHDSHLSYYVKNQIDPIDTQVLFQSFAPPRNYKGERGFAWLSHLCSQKGVLLSEVIMISKNSSLSFEEAVKKLSNYILEAKKKNAFIKEADLEKIIKSNEEALEKIKSRARTEYKESNPKNA